MSYCINPQCQSRKAPEGLSYCPACGTDLIVNGRYQLIRLLQESSPLKTTEVFLASDGSITPKVIKVLSSQNQDQIQRLEQEAFVLRTFMGPGVPNFNTEDYFQWHPSQSPHFYHCLVMQFIEGQNLEQWVNTKGRASQSLILNWLSQLTKILQRFHLGRIYQDQATRDFAEFSEYSFIHCDIKPQNLMLHHDGQLYVIDYGFMTPVGQLTGSQTVGTIGYIAPEQANGRPVLQSDFYAMGKTMIRMATGVALDTLKTDPRTGQLLWHHLATQIDLPLATFLDSLVALSLGLRPSTDQVILERLQKLPGQIKRYRQRRLIKSPPVIIAISIAVVLAAIFIYRRVFAEVYYRWGLDSQRVGQIEDSKIKLLQSLELQPNRADTRSALGLSYHLLGDIKGAVDQYTVSIQLNPNSWNTHYNFGALYDDTKNYKQSQIEYQAAMNKPGGKNYLVLNNLARVSNLTQQYTKAITLVNQGLALNPNDENRANLLKNLGWALYGQNDFRASQKFLQKSLELSHSRADPYCLLAQVQERLNNKQDADDAWLECLVQNSINPEVKEWRKLIIRRLRPNGLI